MTIDRYNRMMQRLEKLQLFWLKANYPKVAIRVNYLYNMAKDGRLDEDQIWDYYCYYLMYDGQSNK